MRGLLTPDEMKVVVGLALEEAYYSSPECISPLISDWESPTPRAIEEHVNRFLSSPSSDTREIGFMLERALEKDKPDPDPIAWRDLALEMSACHLNLMDYMCRVSEFILEERDDKKKIMLSQAWDVIQRWQGDIGETIADLRESNWNDAKIAVDKAYDLSLSADLDSFVLEYQNFRGAITLQREDTEKFRSKIREYPSKVVIPESRVSTILRVQERLLGLLRIRGTNESDGVIRDATSYPIEKLGTAIRYLMSPDVEVESANYEIGIGRDHLGPRVKTILGTVGKQLAKIEGELDIIFSELPAKPWPVKGFGAPGAESRFRDKRT